MSPRRSWPINDPSTMQRLSISCQSQRCGGSTSHRERTDTTGPTRRIDPDHASSESLAKPSGIQTDSHGVLNHCDWILTDEIQSATNRDRIKNFRTKLVPGAIHSSWPSRMRRKETKDHETKAGVANGNANM